MIDLYLKKYFEFMLMNLLGDLLSPNDNNLYLL